MYFPTFSWKHEVFNSNWSCQEIAMLINTQKQRKKIIFGKPLSFISGFFAVEKNLLNVLYIARYVCPCQQKFVEKLIKKLKKKTGKQNLIN